MNNPPTSRPERVRSVMITLEVCKNRSAGPYGSIEMIVSSLGFEQSTFYFWPLDESSFLKSSQLADLVNVAGREINNVIVEKCNIQDALFLREGPTH